MRVHLKTILAGPQYNFSPGERDIPDSLALELIESGHAERIEHMVPTQTVEVEVEAEEEDSEGADDDKGERTGKRRRRSRKPASKHPSGQSE